MKLKRSALLLGGEHQTRRPPVLFTRLLRRDGILV